MARAALRRRAIPPTSTHSASALPSCRPPRAAPVPC